MDDALPFNIYSVRPDVPEGTLPVRNAGGFWQVGRLPNGMPAARPVNSRLRPTGGYVPLDPLVFEAYFTALTEEETAQCLAGPSADDPRLLDRWYEERRAGTSGAAEPEKISSSAFVKGETSFTPLIHPDDLLQRLDSLDLAPPAVKDAGKNASPAMADFDEAALDERNLKLENFIRAEFNRVIEDIDNPDGRAAESVRGLLQSGLTFTWKQKYLFTELGLALRRKKKHELALMSHLRALNFSPNDEHVLFNVARAEYELGNIAQAKVHLERALAAAPNFEAARSFLNFLGQGLS